MAPPLTFAVLDRLAERLGIDPRVQWIRNPASFELEPVTVTLTWEDFMALAIPHLGEARA